MYETLDTFGLSQPQFEHLYYVEVECADNISVGKVTDGWLLIIPILGGRFEGAKIKGTIMPVGADWNTMFLGIKSRLRPSTRYVLKTDDGAIISLFTEARMKISTLKLLKLMITRKRIDTSKYYFRQHLYFTTGDSRYAWLNTAVAFAVIGMGDNMKVCYNAYMLK